MSIQGRVYSVSQVNSYIKDLLDRDGLLSGLFVRGEISNYKMYPSGHHYFSTARSSLRMASETCMWPLNS